MYLAAFEMGRVSAFFLESRIVLDEKKADSSLLPDKLNTYSNSYSNTNGIKF
jgi:hypothetical protein